MSGDNIGLLMKVSGTVTRVHEASGVIDRIYIQDASGSTACVYINGYIWNSITKNDNFGRTGKSVNVGDRVTAIGLGSVDVDELGEVEYLHRLRVRDRAEIEFITGSGGSSGTDSSSTATETPEKPVAPETPEARVPEKVAIVKMEISTAPVAATVGEDGLYYNADGEKVTNAIVKCEDETLYILDKNGEKISSAMVITKNGTKYIIDNSGAIVTGKIVNTNGNSYYAAKNTGKVAANKVITVNKDKYVASKSGAFVKGKIVTMSGNSYYTAKNTGRWLLTR